MYFDFLFRTAVLHEDKINHVRQGRRIVLCTYPMQFQFILEPVLKVSKYTKITNC